MAELGDMLANLSSGSNETDPIEATIKGITVEMLDYDYVDKCKDIKILRGILALLKSGKEGHYPDVRFLVFKRLHYAETVRKIKLCLYLFDVI